MLWKTIESGNQIPIIQILIIRRITPVVRFGDKGVFRNIKRRFIGTAIIAG